MRKGHVYVNNGNASQSSFPTYKDGVCGQKHLVHARHDGECGRVIYDRGFDPRLGERSSHGVTSEVRGPLADNDLKPTLLRRCRLEKLFRKWTGGGGMRDD